MSEKFKTFLISYQHEGKTWGAEIMARDFEDARIRLSKLPHAKLDGELMFSLPAELGLFAKLAVFTKNVFRGVLPS